MTALWGLFFSQFEKTEGGGFMIPLQRTFGESETFYQSKFSLRDPIQRNKPNNEYVQVIADR